jgi:prepilin-type N-terminal cleavage/methylation domain-containing protein
MGRSSFGNSRGFSMLDMLITVAIIGILAAIAIPDYKLAQDKAKWVEGELVMNSLLKATIAHQALHGQAPTLDEVLKEIGWDQAQISNPLGIQLALAAGAACRATKTVAVELPLAALIGTAHAGPDDYDADTPSPGKNPVEEVKEEAPPGATIINAGTNTKNKNWQITQLLLSNVPDVACYVGVPTFLGAYLQYVTPYPVLAGCANGMGDTFKGRLSWGDLAVIQAL